MVKLLIDIAVILKAGLNGKIFIQFISQFFLFFGNSESNRSNSELFSGVSNKTSPTRTNIKHSLSALKVNFFANQIQFRFLRSIEIFIIFPISTCIC